MKARFYRFAEFELATAEAELRTAGAIVRLQEKPLLLLSVLLDHPQTLVTREQLKERMWPSDTFVDYEQGINVAIKKVRSALGDSADKPRFIETIAKKGYRFLVPVDVMEAVPSLPAIPPNTPAITDLPSPGGTTRVRRRRWIYGGIYCSLAAILLLFVLWFFQERAKSGHLKRIHSLAVLPLRNLSPDSGQDYFADGITEDLITNFAQSLPLRIISRTSVMRYRQTNEPVAQIARELGVEAIVEGAVARSGERITVTVQLIDATEDRHLWAQKYDRKISDLLGMEAELSQQIASQIGGTLRAQEFSLAPARHVDPQVYELCLLGRYHWNKRTPTDLRKSAEYYEQAIARDPAYAPAYAGLANAYALLPSYDSVDAAEAYGKAEEAARHALQLEQNLAEAHAVLGIIYLNNGTGWERAGPEMQHAVELNPNYATSHHWLAFYLLFSGQAEKAVAEMERARELDPLSAIINADEGQFLYCIRRYADAQIRLRQAIDLEPDFGQPHETLALIALETGNTSEALREARAGLRLDPTNANTMGEAGYVLAVTGHADEAKTLLAALKDLVRRESATSSAVALVEIGLGERDEAAKTVDTKLAAQRWHAFEQLFPRLR